MSTTAATLASIITLLPISYEPVPRETLVNMYNSELEFIDWWNQEQNLVSISPLTCEDRYCYAQLNFNHDNSTAIVIYTGLVNPDNGARVVCSFSSGSTVNSSTVSGYFFVKLKDGSSSPYFYNELDLIKEALKINKLPEKRYPHKENINFIYNIDFFDKT